MLEQMALLYDMKAAGDEFASGELLLKVAQFTALLGREISVYIARDGRIIDVSVGDADKVTMPHMRLVRNADRLCGIRCIHTHPNGDGHLSGVDLGTLRSMRLDSIAALGVLGDGAITALYAAYLDELKDGEREALILGPFQPDKLPHAALLHEIALADARMKSVARDTVEARPERAILVGIENAEIYDTLLELKELARTAGAEVVFISLQRRRAVDNATYIGSGKAQELALTASELDADLFIFDDELSAVQIRNLEELLGTRVIDRTQLILDIFALRAQSREGKLQVELAQLKYRLPRLLGKGLVLSRLGAGIGTRGPGEKKLEIDRRRIRRRIFELEEELKEIGKQRDLRRSARKGHQIPLAALVGYTNAGKSTLLNAISGAGVLVEDMLFATLDPVVRQTALPGGTQVLVSDTVGFINKLPHDLIEAFKSTLEEVRDADLILHVIDCSSQYYATQKTVVEDVLTHLGASGTPRIDVYNKIDIAEALPGPNGHSAFVSALSGKGMPALLNQIEQTLSNLRTEVEFFIPYAKYEAISLIRAHGRILEETHEDGGTRIKALLPHETLWKLKKIL